MKTMKKLFALLLALTMVFGLAATGFAATTSADNTNDEVKTGVISISKTIKGTTYNAYRLLQLVSFKAETPDGDDGNTSPDGSYVYMVDEDWADFFAAAANGNDAGPGLTYVDIDDQGYVTWKENAKAEELAAAASEWLADHETITADGSDKSDADNATVTINNLPLGYYLVDTNAGSLCSLNTTDLTAEIEEKNEIPEVKKEVKEDPSDDWADNNTAGVGEVVEFRATITAKKGAQNYILHDSMSIGLEFIEVTGVYHNDTNEEKSEANKMTDQTDYKVVTDDLEEKDPCDFHVKILKELEDGDTVTVYYTARVTKSAVVDTADTNTAKIEYGDKHFTEEDTTKTKTYEAKIQKFTYVTEGSDKTEKPLAGAKFVLSDKKMMSATDTPINFVKVDDITDAIYQACFNEDCEDTHITEIETDATGVFVLTGLDAGTYYLHELEAPTGYNKLAGSVEIIIDEDGNVNPTTDDSGNTTGVDVVKVENNSGTELPSTGGMGTTLFYVVGSLMVLGAAVLLVAKKRSNT